MSTRVAPAPTVVSDDGRGGGPGGAAATLGGRVRLLALPGVSSGAGGAVRVRLDAGAVAGATGLRIDFLTPSGDISETVTKTDDSGGASSRDGWGWRGTIGVARGDDGTDVEIRGLAMTDGLGAAVRDVSAVAALVMPMLRVGGPFFPVAGGTSVAAPAGPGEPVALVPSVAPADLDALACGIDYTEALHPSDLPPFLDESASGWGKQIYAFDLRVLTVDLDAQGVGEPADAGLWADVLGYGSADDAVDENDGFRAAHGSEVLASAADGWSDHE